MSELVRVDLDVLPSEPEYRPMGRMAWYGRTFPALFITGIGVAVLGAWVSPIVAWVGVLGLLGWSFSRRRAMHGHLRDNDDGVALLVSGELTAAAQIFDKLCTRSRGTPALHSLFVYNRAVTHLEAGELDRAVALLSAVLHAGWIGPKGVLAVHYPSVLGRLAIAEALRGRLQQADGWRARAHAATSAAKRGTLLLLDTVVESRLGNFKRVVEIVEDGWSRSENMLNAKQLRTLRLLQGFALERLAGSDYRAVSREGDLRRAVEAVRDGRRGEFDFLAVAWEELQSFLQRHRLSA
jgi:hypothetical protein